MARKKGKPAYPRKSKSVSVYMPLSSFRKMKAASKRTKKSDSDVVTHCLEETADSITPATPGFGPEGGA